MLSIVLLAIAVVVAVVAYRMSESFKRANGVTPWRIPSFVWALIGFLSLLLCAVLMFIAQRTTKPVVGGGAPSVAALGPGWHPDPSGRHQFRYWDGSRWTEQVSTQGVAGTDPV